MLTTGEQADAVAESLSRPAQSHVTAATESSEYVKLVILWVAGCMSRVAFRVNVRAIACDPQAEDALRRENRKRAMSTGLPFEKVGMGPNADSVVLLEWADAVWEGLARARGADVSCPPRPTGNWAEVAEFAASGSRPRWVEEYDEVNRGITFLGVGVDFEGTSGRTCVYATLAVMRNETIEFHVVSCAPRGVGEQAGPQWMIDFLKLASVVFVFKEEEAVRLHSRGVIRVWDTQARVPWVDHKMPALADAWSVAVGAGLGVQSHHKTHDESVRWIKSLGEWQDIYHNNSTLSEYHLDRGWKYAMADCVATLQLGLVQWIRGDDVFILEVSESQRKKHRFDWLSWQKSNMDPWGSGPSRPEPQPPRDRPACAIPPQPVPCPTMLFVAKTELRKMWCRSRDDAPDAIEPSYMMSVGP